MLLTRRLGQLVLQNRKLGQLPFALCRGQMLNVAYGLCYGLFGPEHQENESRNFGRSLQTVSRHPIWAVRYLVRTCFTTFPACLLACM